MAKMKYWDSAAAAWKTLDAANGDTVDGLHFRINVGKLQYSTDGTNWVNTGVDTSDATSLAADILAGKTAYVNGIKVTGTMVDRAGDTAAASLTRSGTTVKLRATAGYRDGTNDFVTHADANDIAANIKKGVTIRSLTGTFTSDATAVAADILAPKTAYVNGVKLTGTGVAGKKVFSSTFTVYSGGGTQIGTYACPFQPSIVIVTCQHWYSGGYDVKFAFNSIESATKAIYNQSLIDVTLSLVSNGFLLTLPSSDFRQNFTVNFTCIE